MMKPDAEVVKLAHLALKNGGEFATKYHTETAILKLAGEIVRFQELWEEYKDGDGKRG